MDQLSKRIKNLEKELDKSQKEKGQLIELIDEKEKSHKEEISQMNKKIENERSHTITLVEELR